MKRSAILLSISFLSFFSNAQTSSDSNSLRHAFSNGQVNGHFRYFFMATDNAPSLTDYHANAIGGYLKYETAPLKGFQLGVGGSFIYNIGSSDLVKPDSLTGQPNRYEAGLFDATDPGNKHDIDGIEELYLKYQWKRGKVVFGRQQVNTPFINPQDGRMRPTVAGGLMSEFSPSKDLKFEAGFLYEISPRSTAKWYTTAGSVGLYPMGLTSEGTRSSYAGNIASKGVALLGFTGNINEKLSMRFSNLFMENVFNSALIEMYYRRELSGHINITSAIQVIRQDVVSNGGNNDATKTYFEPGGRAFTFGFQAGLEGAQWGSSLNFNRITAGGRYLMPREWGRDPFFTFLPRERNEGLGDVNAYVLKFQYGLPKVGVKLQTGIGYYDLPEVTNYKLNKYGIPSYLQVNIDLRYSFSGSLKGLEAQLLYVHKNKPDQVAADARHIINKVDMNLWNIVFNYHFGWHRSPSGNIGNTVAP